MGKKERFYVTFLRDELEKRTLRNELYSLRSFAQSLEIDPSILSKVLNRKQHLRLEVAEQVCNKLDLICYQ